MAAGNLFVLIPQSLQKAFEQVSKEKSIAAKLTPEQNELFAKLSEFFAIVESCHFIPPAKRAERDRLYDAVYNSILPKILFPERTLAEGETSYLIPATEDIIFAAAGLGQEGGSDDDTLVGLLFTNKRILIFINELRSFSDYDTPAGKKEICICTQTPIHHLNAFSVSAPSKDHKYGVLSVVIKKPKHVLEAWKAFVEMVKEDGQEDMLKNMELSDEYSISIEISNSIARKFLLEMARTIEAASELLNVRVSIERVARDKET